MQTFNTFNCPILDYCKLTVSTIAAYSCSLELNGVMEILKEQQLHKYLKQPSQH